MVPTPKSSQERRRKKYEKTLKNQENLSKINEARISFLRSQYITPEMYENQQYSSKEIQVCLPLAWINKQYHDEKSWNLCFFSVINACLINKCSFL